MVPSPPGASHLAGKSKRGLTERPDTPGLYRANAESGKRSRNAGGEPCPAHLSEVRCAAGLRSARFGLAWVAPTTGARRCAGPACAGSVDDPESPSRISDPPAATHRSGSRRTRRRALYLLSPAVAPVILPWHRLSCRGTGSGLPTCRRGEIPALTRRPAGRSLAA